MSPASLLLSSSSSRDGFRSNQERLSKRLTRRQSQGWRFSRHDDFKHFWKWKEKPGVWVVPSLKVGPQKDGHGIRKPKHSRWFPCYNTVAVTIKSVLNCISSFCAFFFFFFLPKKAKTKSLNPEEQEGDAVINVLKHSSPHCPVYTAVIFVFSTQAASFLTGVTLL